MARKPDTPCAVCGVLMWSGTNSLPEGQATCLTCRRANPAKPKQYYARKVCTGMCLRCGIQLPPTVGPTRQYCSEECRRLKACEVCGEDYYPHTPMQRTCSRTCGLQIKAKHTPPPKPPKVYPTYTCKGCGTTSKPSDKWRAWCSYQCQIDGSGQRVMDLYRLACAHGWSGARWRAMLVGYLRERDGDRCAICNQAIRFDIPSGPRGKDKGHSIDHLLPRSAGGGDELNNLRLTHWGCNRQRRTASREEIQLALVG